MKTPLFVLGFALFLAGSLSAQPLPQKPESSREIREKAAAKIDTSYRRELKEREAAYIRKGDLEGARAMEALIEGTSSDAQPEAPQKNDPLTGTVWSFHKSDGGKINEFKFLKDGSVDCRESYPDASWARLNASTILFSYGIKAFIVFHVSETNADSMQGYHSLVGKRRSLKRMK